jgi:hypothetical protein
MPNIPTFELLLENETDSVAASAGHTRDRHSGRHDLICSIAVAGFGGGQSLQD